MHNDLTVVISAAALVLFGSAPLASQSIESGVSPRMESKDKGSFGPESLAARWSEGSGSYSGLSEEGPPGEGHPELAKGLDLKGK